MKREYLRRRAEMVTGQLLIIRNIDIVGYLTDCGRVKYYASERL